MASFLLIDADEPLKSIQQSLIPLLILLIILMLLIKQSKKSKLPPGPPKLPLIGNMTDLASPSPHCNLRDLAQKYGPLMHLNLGMVSTVIVSSAEVAEEIMKSKDLIFSDRPKLVAPKILGYNYSDIAFASYGTYWRQMRKICILELLTSKRVNSFRDIREEEAGQLICAIASKCGETVNLAAELFVSSNDIITKATFGRKLDDQGRFRDALKEATTLAAGFQIGDFFPSLSFVGSMTGMHRRLRKNFVELDSILNGVIHDRLQRTNGNKPELENLLDVLLHVKDDEGLDAPLTIDNIKSIITELIIGGSENSSNTVEWAMAEMMKNPRIMKKAQEEIREVVGRKRKVEESDLHKLCYTKLVVKETLRFHPPVPLLLPRESRERCTINGYEIPARTRTIVNYWAISRDPKSWENPDKFEPDRFKNSSVDVSGHNFEYIPFGAGRRICPGISMGMVTTELLFAALLYHFDWKLGSGMKPEDLDMDETFGMTLYRTNNLRLVPTLQIPPLPS